MSKAQIKAAEELLERVVAAHAAIADVVANLPQDGSVEALEACLDYVEDIGIRADTAGYTNLKIIADDLHVHFGVETGCMMPDMGAKMLKWLGDVLLHMESPDNSDIIEDLLKPLPVDILAEIRKDIDAIPDVEETEIDEIEIGNQIETAAATTEDQSVAVIDEDQFAMMTSDNLTKPVIETGNSKNEWSQEETENEFSAKVVLDYSPDEVGLAEFAVEQSSKDFPEGKVVDGAGGLPADPDNDEFDMSIFDEDESNTFDTDSMLGILASELHDISPQLNELAELMANTEDPEELIEAAGSYQNLVYRVSSASESLGLQGLMLVCEFVVNNTLLAAGLALSKRAESCDLLKGWTQVLIDHLIAPKDDALCIAVVDYLEDDNWPEPLAYRDIRDLIDGLTKELEMSGDYEVEARETRAEPEDVALEISEDVSPKLIEAFFAESPDHAETFSSLVEAIANGEDIQNNVEAAQRIAHTLKGSGNLVGARGIANLSHHVEDIFEYIAKNKITPPQVLARSLQEAADTIEVMFEYLQGMAPAPEEAQRVLQDVLDWANRIDSGNLREEDFSEDRMLDVTSSMNLSSSESSDPAEASDENGQASDIPLRRASDAPKMGEAVRVPTNMLDNIFRIVGETAIAIGRIQEHLRRLEDGNKSIRKNDVTLQQRRYELENLVGIRGLAARHRSAAAAGGDSGFDPLEMDEYDEFYGVTHSYIEGVADSRAILRDITDEVSELNSLFLLQQRLNKELQQLVMRTRMVPVSSITARLQRAVRQVCRATGKQAELTIIGEDLLLDGEVLNKLADPLMHMLRNAVDHSIETDSNRFDMGKSKAGTISLSFLQEGNSVIVACVDDGTGLNYDRIREIGIKNGLITAQEQVDNPLLARMILQSGFSTSDRVTQISGRGVGLDVVHNSIQSLNGSMDITDAVNGGTQVTLRLPITLLTSHCLLAREGREGKEMVYAIPTSTLAQILSPGTGQIGNLGGELTFQMGQDVYPACSLNSLMGLSSDDEDIGQNSTVLLLQTAEGMTAITVDRVASSHDLVIKNMGAYVKNIRGVVGVSTLGDGSVVAVLDLASLLQDSGTNSGRGKSSSVTPEREMVQLPKVLVVDDSLSVRSSLSQLMSDGGYQSITARDGIEAVDLLEKENPDIVLTDLEMPRMNGLELTSYIRSSDRWGLLPVVMITSRTMAKHRQQAEQLGVSHYITKPFTEDDVLASIEDYLTRA
jgi:chemosensory pili system protein ChpA (sensor histidine kinase/response regulator)